jgi:hypothetical protein
VLHGPLSPLDIHREQRGNNSQVADGIDEEAPGLAGQGDEDARDRRPNEAGGVDERGIQSDGVGKVLSLSDHLDEERLPCRHVESIQDALNQAEDDDGLDGAM